jgi:hypothetical protein
MEKTDSPQCPEGFLVDRWLNFYASFSGFQETKDLWNTYRSVKEIEAIIDSVESDCIKQNYDLEKLGGASYL